MGRDIRWYKPLPWPFYLLREVSFFLPKGSSRLQKSHRPKILIIIDGYCRVTVPNIDSFELKPGDIMIIPSLCNHSYESLPGLKGHDIHCVALFFRERLCSAESGEGFVSYEWAETVCSLFDHPARLPGCFNLEIERAILQCLNELDGRRHGFATRIYSLLMSFLVLLDRESRETVSASVVDVGSREYIVNAAREVIHKSVFSRIHLADIAAQLNFSEEHLSRVFREETGESVMGYLRQRRIEVAKKELIQSNDLVKQISRRLAFRDASHFAKVFRRVTGTSPQEFRASHHGRAMPID